MQVGDILKNNAGQEFKILNIFRKRRQDSKSSYEMATVQFLETGTTKEVYTSNLYYGKVRDEYAPSYYDIGYLGFRDKDCGYYKQGNQLWRNMLKRCYCEKDPRGYFGYAFVCKRWLCLANFLEDLPKLKNFDKWLEGGVCSSTRYNLDKDVLGDGVWYSPHNCQFITEFENKSLGGKSRQSTYKTRKKQ